MGRMGGGVLEETLLFVGGEEEGDDFEVGAVKTYLVDEVGKGTGVDKLGGLERLKIFGELEI